MNEVEHPERRICDLGVEPADFDRSDRITPVEFLEGACTGRDQITVVINDPPLLPAEPGVVDDLRNPADLDIDQDTSEKLAARHDRREIDDQIFVCIAHLLGHSFPE